MEETYARAMATPEWAEFIQLIHQDGVSFRAERYMLE